MIRKQHRAKFRNWPATYKYSHRLTNILGILNFCKLRRSHSPVFLLTWTIIWEAMHAQSSMNSVLLQFWFTITNKTCNLYLIITVGSMLCNFILWWSNSVCPGNIFRNFNRLYLNSEDKYLKNDENILNDAIETVKRFCYYPFCSNKGICDAEWHGSKSQYSSNIKILTPHDIGRTLAISWAWFALISVEHWLLLDPDLRWSWWNIGFN